MADGTLSPLKALAAALRRRFSGQTTDERAEGARAGAEEVSKRLPEAVMPRSAIEEDRRRKAMIDALGRGE